MNTVNWNCNSEDICNFISGGTTATTFLIGFEVKVTKCSILSPNKFDARGDPGSILSVDSNDDTITAKTMNGAVMIEEYVFEDLKATRIHSFIKYVPAGYSLKFSSVPFLTNYEANLWETIRERILEGVSSSYETTRISIEDQPADYRLVNANSDFAKYLINKLNLKPGSHFLDIGCGAGWTCYMFNELGMNVHGCDIRPRAINVATRLVPYGNFFMLDVFDLPTRPDLQGKFDLVFCRDLGIAQKIVNWDDQSWINVGESMVELLTEDGFLYWIQMTNRTDRITPDGFSNPSVRTLRKYFEQFAHVVECNVLGYVSLLITRKVNSNKKALLLEAFNRKRDAYLYNRWLAERTSRNAWDLAKVLLARASGELLYNYYNDTTIAILGTDTIEHAYVKACENVGLRVDVFAWEKSGRGIFADRLVLPIQSRMDNKPSIPIDGFVVDTKEIRIVKVNDFENITTNDQYPIYLISGDQDEAFNSVLSEMVRILELNSSRVSSEVLALSNTHFNIDSEKKLTGWLFQGDRMEVVTVSNTRSAVKITGDRQRTSYLLQRLEDTDKVKGCQLSIGCWIKCDTPNSARVQFSTDKEDDTASRTHSGDNQWQFCAASKEIGSSIKYVDVYLQLIADGNATFFDPITAVGAYPQI